MRIDWEAVVRSARSRRVSITVRGWRETPDSASELWMPGRVVRITDQWLALDRELLLSTVEYSISAVGTTSRLTLLPENAFIARLEPEPDDPAGFLG